MSRDPYEFTPDDVKYLSHLAEKVSAVAEWHGSRLVVEVYDKADTRPIAWIEVHPSDNAPTVRFGALS